MKRTRDEQMIEDYLLGTLPKAEMERLDQLSLTDDDFAVRLSAGENDLVDAYVRGELPSSTFERFELNYLTTPRGREKVKFALTFYKKLSQPQSTTDLSWRSRLSNIFAVPNLSLQWGFAAASLLMLLLGGYLIFANVRLQSEIDRAQAEQRALKQREEQLQQQLSQQPSSANSELAKVRQQLKQLQQQLDEIPNQNVAEQEVKLIALNLAPQMRGIGKIPTISLPDQADFIALTLALETTDFQTYQIALKDPATDKILWQSGRVKIEKNSNSILIGMPAKILKAQNYLIELSGISANGAPEIISGYSFRVIS